jgi:hypothetical protein
MSFQKLDTHILETEIKTDELVLHGMSQLFMTTLTG